MGELLKFLPQLSHLLYDLLHNIRAERQIDAVLVLGQGGQYLLFQLRVQRHYPKLPIFAELPGNGPSQCAAHLFGDHVDIMGRGTGLHHRLQNGRQIPDGDALPQQAAQDLFQVGVGDDVGDHIGHQLRLRLFQILHKLQGLRAVEQLIGMLFDRLRQVGKHNGQGCDNRIPVDLRHFLVLRQNPAGGDAVGRLHRLNPVNRSRRIGRLQGQIIVHQNLSPGHLLPPDFDHILVGSQRCTVVEADGGDDKAHILGILPAEYHNAADQLAAAFLIHQRDQAVAEFHLDRLHRQEGIDIVDVLEVVGFAGRLKLRGGCRLRGGLFLQCLLLSELPVAQEAANTQAAAHQQERRRGSAGHQPQQR